MLTAAFTFTPVQKKRPFLNSKYLADSLVQMLGYSPLF